MITQLQTGLEMSDVFKIGIASILSIIGIAISYKNYKKKSPNTSSPLQIENNPQNNNTNNNTNNVVVNFASDLNNSNSDKKSINDNNYDAGKIEKNNDREEGEKKSHFAVSREAKIESLKSKVKILFIDDDKKFNVVKILKDSNWKNTSAVVDIKSLDIPIVKEADIFFVDVNGVGKLLNCEHEGLDIALMLKQKYPSKKIVIYSANSYNNNFHKAWDACDFKLEKNALPYQFQSLVEQYSLELYS